MRKYSHGTRKTIVFMILAAVLLTIALNIEPVLDFFGFLLSAAAPVIAGLCIAFVLNVPLAFFEKTAFAFMDKSKKKYMPTLKKALCIICTLIVVFSILVLVCAVVIPVLVDAIRNIIANAGAYAKNIPNWITKLMKYANVSDEAIKKYSIDRTQFINSVVEFLREKATGLISKTASITVSVVSGTFDVLLAFVVAVYTLAYKKKIQAFCNRCLDCFASEKLARNVRTVARVTYKSFYSFILGQFVENIILGALCYIGMSLCGFPYAAAISVLVAVAQFVPVIGGIISATVGSLFMLTDSWVTAVLFLVFIIVIQQIEGNLIYPKVVGDKVGLPGIAVLSAVIVGGNLFGILGVLIGIPCVATIYALVKLAMEKREKQKDAESSLDGA